MNKHLNRLKIGKNLILLKTLKKKSMKLSTLNKKQFSESLYDTYSVNMNKSSNFSLSLFVARSLSESDVLFVFNGITERKLYIDNEAVCRNHYDFTTDEKKQLRSFGIKI